LLIVAVVAGDDRYTSGAHQAPGGTLVTHAAMDVRRRANENEAGGLDGVGKLRALAQKPIAGMDRIGSRVPGSIEDGGDVEVGPGRLRGSDVSRLVGDANVQGTLVDIRVDGNRPDPHRSTRAGDADGDLAAVGDQDLGDALHRRCPAEGGHERWFERGLLVPPLPHRGRGLG